MKIDPWKKTMLIGILGGGSSAAFSAIIDPSKYNFPRDLGSGRLWKFFVEGALTAVVAIVLAADRK